VERRALEQAHRGPRLLLEEVQLLRREPGLHQPLRRGVATTLVDRIEAIVAETGQTGFHFVDEAAPPKSLKALAAELQARRVGISWWGNIRFEKSFTPLLCQQLADSGCIAISGGLEVASDRLLALMKKGVSVEQVARVTKGFADAGILVHAYLMYGFPTQTVQDTVDALETCASCLPKAASRAASGTALPAPCTRRWGWIRRPTA
jgi:radical SAM superfamily enzyme YgiQ (UPF0313 family)